MNAERATHLALLLGRLLDTHQKQISLAEEWREHSDFFLGWECARQDNILLEAIGALNDFLVQENMEPLKIEQTDIRSIDDWQEALLLRSKIIYKVYEKMRQRGLRESLSPDEIFPELGVS